MLPNSRRPVLLIVALLLFVPVALLQHVIDPQRAQYEPNQGKTGTAASKLPIEFALGALVGFREAVAGLLWVRTDDFFHEGNYDAITPMIRIITWLDPHQVDVYETGAWHMDYNFTDSSQRSDRRYIPLSIALMQEGIANNPNVADMYSDFAFTHFFRKIADFPRAAEVFGQGQEMVESLKRQAAAAPNDRDAQTEANKARTSVNTLSHGLAHALEAEGRIPDAIRQWQYCVAQHEANVAAGIGKDYGEASSLTVAKKQLFEMQMRAKWRPRDTQNPVPMHFTAQVVRVAPKVFVVKGTLDAIGSQNFVLETGQRTWGPADGCRIEVRVQDAGYKMPVLSSFSLSSININPETTIMQDAVSVRGGKWEKKIDMSQDPVMYSFTAPKYEVTFWFNPGNPNDDPLNVQDRIGWHGEGMTDAKYLDTSGIVPGDTTAPIPGLRQIKKTMVLTRADFLGQGAKTFE